MRLLLAISGGIDSMYMADRALDGALFDFDYTFSVAHCNFHLRGEESDGDMRFVRKWCLKHNVEFLSAEFDTAAFARENKISTEMAARELRYTWFADLCLSRGFDAVVVAHNCDDNVETLFLNMLRGCGSKGMSGMREDSGHFPRRILRPLLTTSREQIFAHMTARSLAWREDRTNSEDMCKRNVLRHKVLPVLKEINPSALATLSKDMLHLREVDEMASDYYAEHKAELNSISALLKLKHWKYVLYRALHEKGFGESVFEDLCRLLVSGGQTSGKTFLSPTWTLSLGSDTLHFTPKTDIKEEANCIKVDGPGTFSLAGRTFSVNIEGIRSSLKTSPGEIIASAGKLRFPFYFRTWREGDRMQPLGMKGQKKISDLFVDLKIPAYKKDAETVIVKDPSDTEVLALLSRRPGEKIKVRREADLEILSIKELTSKCSE